MLTISTLRVHTYEFMYKKIEYRLMDRWISYRYINEYIET